MNLIVSLQSELLKTKRTSAWYLVSALAFGMALLISVDYFNTPANADRPIDSNPWQGYFQSGFQVANALVMPLVIVLLFTVLPQIEYRNNTWKQLMASPQKKLTIFLAKYGVGLLFMVLFVICLNVSILAMSILIDFVRGNAQFRSHPVPFGYLGELNMRTFFCMLTITAIQFWAGLRFKNFFVPIAVGFGLWFSGGLIAFELHLPGAHWHPSTYGIYSMFDKYKELWTALMWRSVAGCVLVLGVTYADFRKR